ncbi:helix-turn-helix transcriptional regulator [Vibrio fluvialis]|nr:helix-turn-helix transcriptional regulator [Vibrio fluvialis]
MVKVVMSNSVVGEFNVRQRGLFTGRVENLKVQDGVLFHNKDIVHKADFSTQREIPPQLIIAIPLESKALMTYGETHQLKGCRFHKSDPIVATAIIYLEPGLVRGAAKAYVRSRSIVLSFSTHWLDTTMNDKTREHFQQVLSQHLSRFDWSLPPHIGQMAEALNLTSSQSAAESLMREAFTLAVWDNLMTNIRQRSFVSSLRHGAQSTRLKMFLMEEKVDDMPLTTIAQELGMSVSTLQRAARKELGMSLQRYLRERKLQQVKVKLEECSVTIQEAAEIAGYAHSANFITAFRKLFGFSPNHMKKGR